MTKAHKRRGLGAAFILAAATAVAMVTPMAASATPSAPAANPPCTVSQTKVISSARAQGIGGVIIAAGTSSTCQDPPAADPAFNGTPPLLFNGAPPVCSSSPCNFGDVMMTRQTGPLVITPIYWEPSAYPMSGRYIDILNQYLAEVSLASGENTNVFSVLNEYYGNNGQIHYNVRLGLPIYDTDALPANGCTLATASESKIYADGSGYSACLDDAQLQAEVNSVTGANRLPHNLSHIYVLYLPKHVESCFNPGSTTTNANSCTINNEPSTAYCAYHGEDLANAVYANLAYPIYESATGFTCGSDINFGTVESPNGNPDADTEVSPTSHEVSEAITDPDVQTGWYDSSGFEIGDECAYIYGATKGRAGALYNQTFFGNHYLTQQEFSNRVFNASGGTAGCVQSQADE